MEAIKLLRKLVTSLIIALVATHLILSFFFYQVVMYRSNLPMILDLAIILALLVLGYLKHRAGDARPRNIYWTYLLAFVIAALLICILITRNPQTSD